MLRRLLPAALALVCASCGGGGGDVPDAPADDDGICVSIQLTGQPGELTRAADLKEEYGSVAENYINYQDLYVMTFSLEDGNEVLTDESTLIEVMWHPDFAGTSYKGASTVYSNGVDVYLTAKLDQTEPAYKDDNDFCIVAVANTGSFKKNIALSQLTKGKTLGELKSALHSEFKPLSGAPTEWSWCPDNTKGTKGGTGIPMFGVKKVNLKGYKSSLFSAWNPYVLHSADGSKELRMLRAFAKVVVEFSDNFEAPTGQTDVKFVNGGGIGKNYSGGFTVIPTLDRMAGFGSTGETGQVKAATSPGDDIVSDTAPTADLQFTVSADGRYACLYLPEYLLNEDGDLNPELTVMIAFGGIPQSFKFRLKRYPKEGEQPQDDVSYWLHLLRNYSYHFKIGIEYGVITVVATEWSKTFYNEFYFG